MQKLLCPVFLLLSLNAISQRERVYVDVDKYQSRPGDTLWIKAYVFKGIYPSNLSTNLYVRLLDEKACLLRQYVFPIMHGQSIGQLIIPDSIPSANYYLVALTRQQFNYDSSFFSVPILVYNKELPRPVHPKKQALPGPSGTTGMIKGITWITNLVDNHVTSLLRIDTPSAPRKLKLAILVNDTAFTAEIRLGNGEKEKYALFPLDTLKDHISLFLYEDSTLLGHQYIPLNHEKSGVKLFTDTLDKSPYGYNSWHLVLPDSIIFFTSITVTDADKSRTSPGSILRLLEAYTDDLSLSSLIADTSYITYSGKASRQSGKGIKDPFSKELTIAGALDSNYLFTRVAGIDEEGKFRLDSLFFFGDMDLQFQINRRINDGSTKDVRLELTRYIPRRLDTVSLKADWIDDEQALRVKDTVLSPWEQQTFELSKLKTLKPFVVKGWKNPRDALDAKYATGFFTEPALYYYDLTQYTDDYNRNIFLYLDAQGGRIRYDVLSDAFRDILGHAIHFFVDEIETDPYLLKMLDFERLAYIKILESDFLSTSRPLPTAVNVGPLHYMDQKTALNVCIYSRKDSDFHTMRGGMNKLTIKGYDPILNFHPDRTTLYCDRHQSGREFKIHFTNNDTTKRFRLKLQGMSYSGKVVHYETVIE